MLESKEKIINIYKSIAQDMRELNALLQLPEKPIMKRKSTKKIPLLHQSNISPVLAEYKLVSASAKILVTEEPFSVSFLSSVDLPNIIDINSTVIIDTPCDTSTSANPTTTSYENTYSYTYNDMNFIYEEDDFISEEDFLTSEDYDFATSILEPFSSSSTSTTTTSFTTSVLPDASACETFPASNLLVCDEKALVSLSLSPIPLMTSSSCERINAFDLFLFYKYYNFDNKPPIYINNNYKTFIWDPGKL
jgi:hypothetical protein